MKCLGRKMVKLSHSHGMEYDAVVKSNGIQKKKIFTEIIYIEVKKQNTGTCIPYDYYFFFEED